MWACGDISQSGDRVIGDELGDALRRVGAVGSVPVSGPVERAEKGARGDDGVWAAASFRGNQRAQAALVAIALGDDSIAQPPWQRVHLQVRCGPLDFVEETEDVRDRQLAKTVGERAPISPAASLGGPKGVEQTVQRTILADGEQQLLSA